MRGTGVVQRVVVNSEPLCGCVCVCESQPKKHPATFSSAATATCWGKPRCLMKTCRNWRHKSWKIQQDDSVAARSPRRHKVMKEVFMNRLNTVLTKPRFFCCKDPFCLFHCPPKPAIVMKTKKNQLSVKQLNLHFQFRCLPWDWIYLRSPNEFTPPKVLCADRNDGNAKGPTHKVWKVIARLSVSVACCLRMDGNWSQQRNPYVRPALRTRLVNRAFVVALCADMMTPDHAVESYSS